MSIKDTVKSTGTISEKRWMLFFRIVGGLMFLAGIWESLVTLFWIGKDVVAMDPFKLKFALAGFVLIAANKNLGSIANNIGGMLTKLIR
ncbi:hypothetical protein [Spongiimicrobium salis]|uniref:hypothetical protein n=1 Tax=Spongiimicrobium salis TaxID=1667022 RepID=UPI00374C8F03